MGLDLFTKKLKKLILETPFYFYIFKLKTIYMLSISKTKLNLLIILCGFFTGTNILYSQSVNRVAPFTPTGMGSNEGKPCIFVLVPDGQTTLNWTEIATWKAIATNMRAKLVLVDGDTNSTSTTSPVWNVAADLTALNTVYTSETASQIEGASRFMVAYGTNASIVLSEYAKKYTNNLAGIAIVDATLTSQTLTSDTSTFALPVLLINTALGSTNSVADFFKTRNKTNTTMAIQYGTVDYNNGYTNHNGNLENTHYVRKASAVQNNDIPEFIKNEMLLKIGRWKTVNGNFTLRPKMINNPNLIKITEYDANGNTPFEAWVYVPTNVRNRTITGPVPMVFILHGNSMNGKYFLDSTAWHELAEEFNFIAYAPTHPNNSWDNGTTEQRYSALIPKWTSDTGLSVNGNVYSINKNKVYLYGFSRGSYITSQLAYKHSNLFAAVAPWAYVDPAPAASGTVSKVKGIPVWYGIGSSDDARDATMISNEKTFSDYFKYHVQTNTPTPKVIFEKAIGDDKLITTTIYTNTVTGLEVRMSLANNVIHGQLHEHVERVWVDFFSKYQKNSQGYSEIISTLKTEEFSLNTVSINPNPTTDSFTINTNEMVSLELFDVTGKLIKFINNVDKTIPIDVSYLDSGLYFAKIKNENSIRTLKIIKK